MVPSGRNGRLGSIDASARIVGLGSIGSRYVRILGKLVTGPVYAVSVSRAAATRNDLPAVRLESLDEALLPTTSLCVVATDTLDHVRYLERYWSSSRSVLIEKPLAPNFSLASIVVENPQYKDVAVSAPFRFTDGFSACRNLLPSLGQVTGAAIECRSWLPGWRPERDYRESYSADPRQGGAMLDLIHEVDLALQLLGRPSHVSALTRSHQALEIEVETAASMLWRYSKFDLNMTLDYVTRPSRRSVSIFGTDASLYWNLLTGCVTYNDHHQIACSEMDFPMDLNRDEVLTRQVLASIGSEQDDRLSSVQQAADSLHLVDVAKASAAQSGVLIPVGHTLGGMHAS